MPTKTCGEASKAGAASCSWGTRTGSEGDCYPRMAAGGRVQLRALGAPGSGSCGGWAPGTAGPGPWGQAWRGTWRRCHCPSTRPARARRGARRGCVAGGGRGTCLAPPGSAVRKLRGSDRSAHLRLGRAAAPCRRTRMARPEGSGTADIFMLIKHCGHAVAARYPKEDNVRKRVWACRRIREAYIKRFIARSRHVSPYSAREFE